MTWQTFEQVGGIILHLGPNTPDKSPRKTNKRWAVRKTEQDLAQAKNERVPSLKKTYPWPRKTPRFTEENLPLAEENSTIHWRKLTPGRGKLHDSLKKTYPWPRKTPRFKKMEPLPHANKRTATLPHCSFPSRDRCFPQQRGGSFALSTACSVDWFMARSLAPIATKLALRPRQNSGVLAGKSRKLEFSWPLVAMPWHANSNFWTVANKPAHVSSPLPFSPRCGDRIVRDSREPGCRFFTLTGFWFYACLWWFSFFCLSTVVGPNLTALCIPKPDLPVFWNQIYLCYAF